MTRPSTLFGLFMALAVVVSTFGIGVAHGRMPAAGEMVICTGQGIVTITVDAEGNPVRSVALCPDNAGTLLADVVIPPVSMAVESERPGERDRPADVPAPRFPTRRLPEARAPPV